jgi:exosortase
LEEIQVATPPPGSAAAPRAAEGTASVSTDRSTTWWPRNATFAILLAASLAIFWSPLAIIVRYPIWTDNTYDKYCYTVIVPFASLALLYLERRTIFAKVHYAFRIGQLLLGTGVLLRVIGGLVQNQIGLDPSISLEVFGLVTFWIGGFFLCYGIGAFRIGMFPILLLLLTVPVPDFLLDKLIVTVQYGSTEVCSFFFTIFRVPVLRDGLVFYLPDIAIRVEKVCSGIHSTMAILLVSLIAAHLFLNSFWRKLLFVLSAVPIVCFTNGFRIAGLTLLAQCVNRGFMYGRLHHQGGVGFFLLALLLLYASMQLLKEKARQPQGSAAPAPHQTV